MSLVATIGESGFALVANVCSYTTAIDRWRKGGALSKARRVDGAGAVLQGGRFIIKDGITQGHNAGAVSCPQLRKTFLQQVAVFQVGNFPTVTEFSRHAML